MKVEMMTKGSRKTRNLKIGSDLSIQFSFLEFVDDDPIFENKIDFVF